MEYYTLTKEAVSPEGGAWGPLGVDPGNLEDARDCVDRGYLTASKPVSVFAGLIGVTGLFCFSRDLLDFPQNINRASYIVDVSIC